MTVETPPRERRLGRSRETSQQAIDRTELLEQAARTLSAVPRPFLRWAGSKQRLLPHIVPALPSTFGRYFEPFMGSASLFFLLKPRRAFLSDACLPLVDVYRAIASDPARVQRLLGPLDPLDKEMYYRVRARRTEDLHKRAAEFIYLNRSCWNGLYRVNSQGVFNVPYGAPKSDSLPDAENLLACAELLGQSGVGLRHGDFQRSVAHAEKGDLVFLDPPYVTGHNNNGFVDYNEQLFGWSDQVRLARTARRLADKGVNVIVTNAYHDRVIELYDGFDIRPIERKSTLASNRAFRGTVVEALICSVANS